MKRMRATIPAIAVGVTLILSGAVALGEEPSDAALAVASGTAVVPDEARNVKNPFASDAGVRETGTIYFNVQCTMCHGKDGRGTGDLVERLKLKMPDFTLPTWQTSRTDGELFYIITKGHGEMPGQKDRFKDEIKWGMINHVRSLRATK